MNEHDVQEASFKTDYHSRFVKARLKCSSVETEKLPKFQRRLGQALPVAVLFTRSRSLPESHKKNDFLASSSNNFSSLRSSRPYLHKENYKIPFGSVYKYGFIILAVKLSAKMNGYMTFRTVKNML